LPQDKAEDIEWIESQLNTMYSGLPLALQKGNDFIPETALALSKELNIENVTKLEVDLKTATRYLQKETIEIPPADKGYILLCYQNIPIGWIKNMGNRNNNLYPQEWRIRMKIF
jgi:NOL1/NOP2/fmu family ribosome biogenesis protein